MHSDDSFLGRLRPSHAGSHHHSMGGKGAQLGARVRWPLQRPSMRRRNYHGGSYIIIMHVFFRLNLPLNKYRRQCYKFRRQCYDGVGNMSGQRTCVAKRIQELEPGRVIFFHINAPGMGRFKLFDLVGYS